jgi:hypothetical protein
MYVSGNRFVYLDFCFSSSIHSRKCCIWPGRKLNLRSGNSLGIELRGHVSWLDSIASFQRNGFKTSLSPAVCQILPGPGTPLSLTLVNCKTGISLCAQRQRAFHSQGLKENGWWFQVKFVIGLCLALSFCALSWFLFCVVSVPVLQTRQDGWPLPHTQVSVSH